MVALILRRVALPDEAAGEPDHDEHRDDNGHLHTHTRARTHARARAHTTHAHTHTHTHTHTYLLTLFMAVVIFTALRRRPRTWQPVMSCANLATMRRGEETPQMAYNTHNNS